MRLLRRLKKNNGTSRTVASIAVSGLAKRKWYQRAMFGILKPNILIRSVSKRKELE